MSLQSLLKKTPSLSKKLQDRWSKMMFGGFFTALIAADKKLRLVTGREKNLCLYWLVDEADGIIVDAKFQAFGPPALLLAADVACELAIHKNYDQASRISADLLDRPMRDKKEEEAFPLDCRSFLNQVLSAIDQAVYQCIDIPYAASDYQNTPISWDQDDATPIPNWDSFADSVKLQVIQEVIEKEIRPYIELDAGGIEIVELIGGSELVISYQGACTTCHSSTGSTLSAIQQILRARVHPGISVSPKL